MSKNQKEKGKRYERKIAKFLNGKRTYGSTGESQGLPSTVDIVSPYGNFQVKARRQLPKWLVINDLYEDKIDGIIVVENYKEPLVIIKLEKYKQLMEKENVQNKYW